ncbi:MAG: hypothetical protein IPG17_30720 [Sandaracinaceae bacterium]|nr:hypothetical protein [Sandaracinaceae bacterium]
MTQTGGDPYDVNAYNIQTISAVSSGEASAWSELIAADYTPMRRFVRLWRATGWPMITLDRALTALGLGDTSGWDDSTLTSIGQLKHLCERLGLDPVEAACWFGALDTWQDRDTAEKPSLSLYDRLFLSPALFSATEQAEAGFPFRLNPEDRSTLASTAEALSDHIARTASVLGLTTSALESLVTALEERTTLDAGASGSLSVASLSLLARWASLGRALGLAPSDALRLTELLGVGPSESTAGPFESLSDAHSLLDDAQQLLSVGFTVDELDYPHPTRRR